MNYKDKFVGIQLYGYCGGYFGDGYRDPIIIASGENWVVAKDPYGGIHFADFRDARDMEPLIKEWSIEEELD